VELTLSVIVCAHNEAGYLGTCLYSRLEPSRPSDEIIVATTTARTRPATSSAVATIHTSSGRTRGRGRRQTVTTSFPSQVSNTFRTWNTCPAVKDALRQNVDIALTLYRNGSWAA